MLHKTLDFFLCMIYNTKLLTENNAANTNVLSLQFYKIPSGCLNYGRREFVMTKTRSMKKVVSLIAAVSIMLSMFCVMGSISASAATDKVKLYSAETYFCKYGITGTNVFVQTKGNEANQQVVVHYNYLKGQAWKDSTAEYVKTLEDGSKLWKAYIQSYNTEYAIKLTANGVNYWDNNNGKNYKDERIGAAVVTANRGGYCYFPGYTINATLQNLAYHKDVKVRYTLNNWASYKDISMKYDSTNKDGTEQWTVNIPDFCQNTSGFQYCISYTVNGRTYWANNFGANYDASYRVYP